jgi:Uri superfamily endonuclease
LKAVYVLIIQVKKPCSLEAGALGILFFHKGMYAYVGSAQSNFHQRINRHLSKEKRLFWHIDYLLNNENTNILKIFFKQGIKKEECILARLINKKGIFIPRFGSSDCKCESHLFRIKDYAFLEKRLKELNKKHNTF